ncbi:MAG: hypothetical protein ACI4OL_05060 [Gemmiger sp.]
MAQYWFVGDGDYRMRHRYGNFYGKGQAAKRLAALLSCGLLLGHLCACGAKPLAERGIVQGIFLNNASQGNYEALILYSTAKSEQEMDTASGTGDTVPQAFSNAVRAMQAEAYYGKTELLVLSNTCSYAQVLEAGELIRQELQPTPTIRVWQAPLDGVMATPESAVDLCETIRQCEKKYRLESGLEKLDANTDSVTLPSLLETGDTLHILGRDSDVWFDSKTQAQLAACLAGKSTALQFDAGDFYVDAKVYPPYQCGTQIQLCLHDVDFRAYNDQTQEQMHRQLILLLQKAFLEVLQTTGWPQRDPLGLSFAVRSESGDAEALTLDVCL